VLDTNVLVSGVFFGGVPGRILSAWAAGEFELVLSPPILDEYQRVGEELGRRYHGLAEHLAGILALVTTHALLVSAPALPSAVSADPDDDMFFAAALASGTQLIVSGDRHLLAVSGWQGIDVMTPRAFANEHLRAV
jgi:putative PIN family toxin of toxin-antitoxin system